ncbi:MAG TPA: hypothetical protein VK892_00575 [Pyrinomonadaceae bacterium]|nr:hypothetical protein [Pyrinomonadaceae bacterium]
MANHGNDKRLADEFQSSPARDKSALDGQNRCLQEILPDEK